MDNDLPGEASHLLQEAVWDRKFIPVLFLAAHFSKSGCHRAKKHKADEGGEHCYNPYHHNPSKQQVLTKPA